MVPGRRWRDGRIQPGRGETVLGGPYAINAGVEPASVLSNYTITSNTANSRLATAAR